MPGVKSGKQRKKELQEKRAAKRDGGRKSSDLEPRAKHSPQAVTGKSFAPKKL